LRRPDALTVNDGGGGAGFAPFLFAGEDIQGVMDAPQRPVPPPQSQVVMAGAARRQIRGQMAPLAARIPAAPVIVRQNWLPAYDFTNAVGAAALNDYARAEDPFAKVGRQQIAVDVSSVIRAFPTSFRVAWTQRRYQDRALADTIRWSAILSVLPPPARRRPAAQESARRLCRRPCSADPRRFHQRDPGLPLFQRRPLPSLRRPRSDHQHPLRSARPDHRPCDRSGL